MGRQVFTELDADYSYFSIDHLATIDSTDDEAYTYEIVSGSDSWVDGVDNEEVVCADIFEGYTKTQIYIRNSFNSFGNIKTFYADFNLVNTGGDESKVINSETLRVELTFEVRSTVFSEIKYLDYRSEFALGTIADYGLDVAFTDSQTEKPIHMP